MAENGNASEAGRALGRIRTEKKSEAVRENLERARESRWTPEARAAHAEKIRQSWERRKQQQSSNGE